MHFVTEECNEERLPFRGFYPESVAKADFSSYYGIGSSHSARQTGKQQTTFQPPTQTISTEFRLGRRILGRSAPAMSVHIPEKSCSGTQQLPYVVPRTLSESTAPEGIPFGAFSWPRPYSNERQQHVNIMADPLSITAPSVPESSKFRSQPHTQIECGFCKRNGDRKEYYRTHVVKDRMGNVVCPVLRSHVCEICGATGNNAHTRSYCPFGVAHNMVALKCTPRNSSSTRCKRFQKK